MDLHFRQRTFGEAIKIVRKRIWMIGLPLAAVLIAVAIVIPGLPNVYESTTFLTLSAPAISEKVAPSLTDESVAQRLQAISSTVLSRSSLEEIIGRFDLYPKERASGVPTEAIVESMKDSVLVEPEKSDNQQIVGFRLTYRYSDPETTQAVTAEIANRFISAQSAESRESAETTKEFIDEQLAQAKADLDSLEQQRLGIMSANVETLPESVQGLIAQLEGLRQRENTISKEKESLMIERARVQESIRALNSQMRLVENFGEKETQEAVNQATRIEDTPAYAQLIQKRAELSAKLANLKQQFRERHPDVIQAQIEIDKVNDELEKLSKTTDQRVRRVNESASRKAELQRRSLEIERDKAEAQVEQMALQMQSKDAEVQRNAIQIAALESKINTVPSVKVALEGVNNQYASAKANYDELLKKFNSAQQQVQRETNEQGATIQIVDPASLPEAPENASKKSMFLGLGAGAGLALGLLLAGFFEIPRLFRIQTIADAEYFTGIPVLATIPPLLDDKEIAKKRRNGTMRVVAGIIMAAIAVPILVVVLNATHVFEMLL